MTTTTRRRALRGGIALVIGLQLLVPAVAMTRTAPTRFGFQMYSRNDALPVLTAVDSSGRADAVALASIAAADRPEIDWPERAASYLCRTRPTLTAVRVELRGRTWTVPC